MGQAQVKLDDIVVIVVEVVVKAIVEVEVQLLFFYLVFMKFYTYNL